MPDSFTNNVGLILMATGTAAGQWGAILNATNFTPLDSILGATTTVSVSSSDVNLSTTQRQSLAFKTSGTLTGAISITTPLSPNSTSAAEGGQFILENNATGSFAITVKTIATGSTGVEVPQGARSLLYSDGLNIAFADDAQNRTQAYNGDPNGHVAGTAGGAVTRASRIVDYSANEEYLCTTTGTSGSAVWSKNLPYTFPSQGYLTASSNATNVVLTADSIAATTIYYSAFRGDQFFVYNGTSFTPVTITNGQMALVLTSSQGASGIYDVMGFLDSGTPRIAFSPAWSTPTAGSGSRGTGAGTPQLIRLNGILVNAVQQTVNNGATTYTIAPRRGTYLGSIRVDSTAGQVTCHVGYGQSRKWGVWNAYNRLPICLKAGDSASSWSVAGTYPTFAASNSDSTNRATVFTGLAEEMAMCEFMQEMLTANTIGYVGIGLNSATTRSGTQGVTDYNASSGVLGATVQAKYRLLPDIGINNIQALEAKAGAVTAQGTESFMLLSVVYNA